MEGNTAPVENSENEIITKTGEHRTIAFHNAVLKNEKGAIIGTLSSGEDITERRKVEERIRKFNEELENRVKERTAQLEEANKYLESFSYSVSHDLRAPLRAIDGFSKILLEDYSKLFDEEAKRLFSVIMDNTHKMGKLIDDFLAFAKVNRLELNVSDINTSNIVGSLIDEAKTANPARRINFIVKDLPNARGDITVIRQVFANFLSNAIKFTKAAETAIIEIGGKQLGKEILFYVKDNGIGFDMKYADKLFGIFQRLHSEKEYDGTGIGLAVIEKVISKHGGSVWAESRPGEGATFYFTLPI